MESERRSNRSEKPFSAHDLASQTNPPSLDVHRNITRLASVVETLSPYALGLTFPRAPKTGPWCDPKTLRRHRLARDLCVVCEIRCLVSEAQLEPPPSSETMLRAFQGRS